MNAGVLRCVMVYQVFPAMMWVWHHVSVRVRNAHRASRSPSHAQVSLLAGAAASSGGSSGDSGAQALQLALYHLPQPTEPPGPAPGPRASLSTEERLLGSGGGAGGEAAAAQGGRRRARLLGLAATPLRPRPAAGLGPGQVSARCAQFMSLGTACLSLKGSHACLDFLEAAIHAHLALTVHGHATCMCVCTCAPSHPPTPRQVQLVKDVPVQAVSSGAGPEAHLDLELRQRDTAAVVASLEQQVGLVT